MLRITIPAGELWDEKNEVFISSKEQTLQLEHSLISLSKWESKWHKPFLSTEEKTVEETIDYIRCMTITQNVNPDKYIEDPMTATTFSDGNQKPSREIITSEIIYHWMVSFNIPFECQKWHLNKLLAFIKVCCNKNLPPRKMSQAEVMKQYSELNEIRKKQLNTKG